MHPVRRASWRTPLWNNNWSLFPCVLYSIRNKKKVSNIDVSGSRAAGCCLSVVVCKLDARLTILKQEHISFSQFVITNPMALCLEEIHSPHVEGHTVAYTNKIGFSWACGRWACRLCWAFVWLTLQSMRARIKSHNCSCVCDSISLWAVNDASTTLQ